MNNANMNMELETHFVKERPQLNKRPFTSVDLAASKDSGFAYEEHYSAVRRSVRIVKNMSKQEYQEELRARTSESPEIAEPSLKLMKTAAYPEEREHPSVAIHDLHKQTVQMISEPLLIVPAKLNNNPKCLMCENSITERTDIMNICNECAMCFTPQDLKCFVCKQSNPTHRCDPSLDCFHLYHEECFKSWTQLGPSGCPQHKCHTCFSNECNRHGFLVKCVECPVAYHPNVFCLPAGSKFLTKTQMICPRHHRAASTLKPLNIDWCILCGDYGSLICCDFCCYSYHAECIDYDEDEQADKEFKCESCLYGTMPLYMTVVWAKPGSFRWWPALVLPDSLVPPSQLALRKCDSEFCVRFFGTRDYFWTTSDRVFAYSGSNIATDQNESSSSLNRAYEVALDECNTVWRYLTMIQQLTTNTVPKPFVEISTNISVAPVDIKSVNYEVDSCNCKKDGPCGPQSGCLNRSTNFECDDTSCLMGDLCQNQRIRKKQNAKVKIVRTLFGFGLATSEDLPSGSFVAEYVGELINDAEFHRRLHEMMMRREKNFYFLAVSSDLYVDAFLFGNLSRFINHSCDPNCVIEIMFVDGFKRAGIYTSDDIKAVSILILESVANPNQI